MAQCIRREAADQAAACASDLLPAGETDGYAMWKRIGRANERLQAPAPTGGEAVH
jgi:hypothetical protein